MFLWNMVYITHNDKIIMNNPNFRPGTIVQLAQKLLFAIYDKTEGDQWKPVEVAKIYNKEITGSYDSTNEPLLNNVLQFLLYREFITLDENRQILYITYEGKKHVYEFHPGFKQEKKANTKSPKTF